MVNKLYERSETMQVSCPTRGYHEGDLGKEVEAEIHAVTIFEKYF